MYICQCNGDQNKRPSSPLSSRDFNICSHSIVYIKRKNKNINTFQLKPNLPSPLAFDLYFSCALCSFPAQLLMTVGSGVPGANFSCLTWAKDGPSASHPVWWHEFLSSSFQWVGEQPSGDPVVWIRWPPATQHSFLWLISTQRLIRSPA